MVRRRLFRQIRDQASRADRRAAAWLRYSLTLHAPDGTRLIGFDNAHAVAPAGSRFAERPIEADHWHRTESDPGRPYRFKDADALILSFFAEVERVLKERGIPLDVVEARRKDERSET